MTNFSIPWLSLLGGALIGASASLLLYLSGRIAGISGIVAGLLRPRAGETAWRAAFVLGLFAGGAIVRAYAPQSFETTPVTVPWIIASGLLVGFGTRLGGGCTSGHGVCGISRLSKRS